jgi:hypothetical protein
MIGRAFERAGLCEKKHGEPPPCFTARNSRFLQRAKLKMQARQWLMGKAQPEKYSDIKTIRDERHPLDAMTEEERMQATIELVEKVKARLDQARALGHPGPPVVDGQSAARTIWGPQDNPRRTAPARQHDRGAATASDDRVGGEGEGAARPGESLGLLPPKEETTDAEYEDEA